MRSVAISGRNRIWLVKVSSHVFSHHGSVIVNSSLRVTEERVRAYALPFQYVAQSYGRCSGFSSCCGKGARACESGSSDIAVGLQICDRNLRCCSSECLDISL